MKKILILLAVIAATAAIYWYKKPAEAPVLQGNFDGRNSTFILEGREVSLVNGAAGTVKYFGNEAKGDLNSDGVDDVAFLVTDQPGGSGTFYYAVAALKTAEGYKTTNAFFVGDRIAPQSTYIPKNSYELQVAYADRKAGEPFTARPSEGKVLLLKVTKEGVLEGLMK